MGVYYGAGKQVKVQRNAAGPCWGDGRAAEGSVFPPATTASVLTSSFVYGDVGDGEHPIAQAGDSFPTLEWTRRSSYAGDDSPNGVVFRMGGSAIREYRTRYQVALNRLRYVKAPVPAQTLRPAAVALRMPLDQIPKGTTSRLPLGKYVTSWPQATMTWPALGGGSSG